jgi:hypothetical protein
MIAIRDKRLLMYLFVGLRLTLLIVYQPYLIDGVERGLTVFGDFQHYFNLASLSTQGWLPYRDYWYEFPPAFPLVSLIVYGLAGAAGGFTPYATLLGVVMLAFDAGNLWLVQRLGARLHSPDIGALLGWVYALLSVPLVFAMWAFEPMVLLALLLALAWMVERRDARAALAVAFGVLTKLYPLIALAALWRFREPRSALRTTLIALAVAGAGLGLMLAAAGEFGVPSLTAQFNKASYQTVWALIDGNLRTGNFGPIADHFEPAKAAELLGNPARIPWWLRGIVFGGIGLLVFARTRRFDERGLVAFASITVVVFFLWSQGWSPQWLMILTPLILLNFPTRMGVLACLMLSLISFVEYPLLFARTAETGGAISADQLPLYAALIGGRTLILIGVGVALYRELRRERRSAHDAPASGA